MLRHRSSRLAALLVVGLAVAACDDAAGPVGNKDIALGGLLSLTGNWATPGVTSKAAMEINGWRYGQSLNNARVNEF